MFMKMFSISFIRFKTSFVFLLHHSFVDCCVTDERTCPKRFKFMTSCSPINHFAVCHLPCFECRKSSQNATKNEMTFVLFRVLSFLFQWQIYLLWEMRAQRAFSLCVVYKNNKWKIITRQRLAPSNWPPTKLQYDFCVSLIFVDDSHDSVFRFLCDGTHAFVNSLFFVHAKWFTRIGFSLLVNFHVVRWINKEQQVFEVIEAQFGALNELRSGL